MTPGTRHIPLLPLLGAGPTIEECNIRVWRTVDHRVHTKSTFSDVACVDSTAAPSNRLCGSNTRDSRHKRDTFYEAMTDQGLWRIPSGERVPNLSALHVGFLYGSSTLRVVPT